MKLTKSVFARAVLPLLFVVLLLGVLVLPAQAVNEADARLRPDYTIVIDGVKRTFYNVNGQQVHPISCRDTTYLPVRAIGELMGKVVGWDEPTKAVTLSGVRTDPATAGTADSSARAKDITVEVRDDFTVIVDGTVRTFYDANGKTVYPLLYQGSTYLPIRAIGELMGKTVSWDGATNTVTLTGSTVTDADVITSSSTVTDADVITSGAATQPAVGNNSGLLSAEDAKAAALSHAGVTAGQATFTKQKLERDDGRQVYDIEFYTDTAKYKYELDAATGKVLSYESKPTAPQASSTGTGTAITRDKAQEIALAKVPGATASNIKKLKLDRDGGKQVYEVEILYNKVEYEIDIDAATGTVLKYEADRH